MSIQKTLLVALVTLVSSTLAWAPANAATHSLQVQMIVLVDEMYELDPGLGIGVGEPHSIELVFSDASPDAEPSPTLYLSSTTGQGWLYNEYSFFSAPAGINTIAADTVPIPAVWVAAGQTLGVFSYEPWAVQIWGDGLTPDQPLPDFTSIDGGFFTIGRQTDRIFRGYITGIELISPPPPPPVPLAGPFFVPLLVTSLITVTALVVRQRRDPRAAGGM